VLMVMPSYYPVIGGMETQVEQLIPFLRRYGVESAVLTRRPANAQAREVRDGTPVTRISVPGGPGLRSLTFTTLGTVHALRHRRRIDILHAHSIMSPTTIAAVAGLLLRRPRVVTLHARYEPEHLLAKPLGAARLRLYRGIIDRFISINADIETLLHQHGMPAPRIVSIPNGIDTSRFQPVAPEERRTLREQRGLPGDRPIAVFVGRLHPVKQIDVLLRAWQGVPDATLVILGDGDERPRLEALHRELGLGERAELRGMVTDVDAWLQAADVFVLPSASEGLSVALLEAMAAGAVPIATAVGGAVELIRDGENGRLVPPGDVEELRTALHDALSRPDWLAHAANLARATVIARFDLDAVARQLARVYRDVLPAR
jgi:glycosyltransferase involved in cell wall biosynthesis